MKFNTTYVLVRSKPQLLAIVTECVNLGCWFAVSPQADGLTAVEVLERHETEALPAGLPKCRTSRDVL